MAIRKYGTEPAKTETRPEDNDPETLSGLVAEGKPLPLEILEEFDRLANDPTYGERRSRPDRH